MVHISSYCSVLREKKLDEPSWYDWGCRDRMQLEKFMRGTFSTLIGSTTQYESEGLGRPAEV